MFRGNYQQLLYEIMFTLPLAVFLVEQGAHLSSCQSLAIGYCRGHS